MAFLKEGERVIFTDRVNDSAVVLFDKAELKLPETLIPLAPIGKPINIGCEVGWLGFPSIEQFTLCFFSGNVSARQDARKAYVLDGVAINGVSGGPVFFSAGEGGVHMIGTMTAYQPNRRGGDSLPGLAYAQDVSHFHEVVQYVRNIDDAERKKKELVEAATKETQAQPVPTLTPPSENPPIKLKIPSQS